MSRGEGPSKGKGKGPDPGNWGDVDFSDEELDLDAQHAAWSLGRLSKSGHVLRATYPGLKRSPRVILV